MVEQNEGDSNQILNQGVPAGQNQNQQNQADNALVGELSDTIKAPPGFKARPFELFNGVQSKYQGWRETLGPRLVLYPAVKSLVTFEGPISSLEVKCL